MSRTWRYYTNVVSVASLTRVCPEHRWPAEKIKLGRKPSGLNSSHRNWLRRNDDRHVRNKVEGVNRSRGEAAETVHHLFIAKLKAYLDETPLRNIPAKI